MKILLFTDSLGAGGAQRQIVGLAKLLKNRGFNVTVATYFNNEFYLNDLIENNIKYDFISSASNVWTRIFSISKYIRKQRPDFVISYQETPSIVASLSRLFNSGFELIVSERNTSQKKGINECIRFNLYRIAKYVVPNSYSQQDFINKNFPFLSKKVKTITNFVDLQRFMPPKNHERHLVPQIIVVASITQSKNTLGFIDAVKLLKDRGLKLHISWWGITDKSDGFLNQCLERIKTLDVSDVIELKIKIQDIAKRYVEADYMCLPSFYEGTPNVICEAISCGLPVACSNVCDNPVYVKQDINGVLFDPEDVNSIANNIEALLGITDSKYHQFRNSSRSIAEGMLSSEKFVEKYINLFQ